jgi:hypothetical protein
MSEVTFKQNREKDVDTANKIFIDLQSIKECIASLKIKNSEGSDWLPQSMLLDILDYLLALITSLIYKQNKIHARTMASCKSFKNIQKGSQKR